MTAPEKPAGSTSRPSHPANHREHAEPIEPIYNIDPLTPISAPPLVISDRMADSLEDRDTSSAALEAIPDPEPPVPSLDTPDTAVFGRDPGKPAS